MQLSHMNPSPEMIGLSTVLKWVFGWFTPGPRSNGKLFQLPKVPAEVTSGNDRYRVPIFLADRAHGDVSSTLDSYDALKEFFFKNNDQTES